MIEQKQSERNVQEILEELTFTKFDKAEDYRKKVLRILKESKRPLNITEVTRLTKLSWIGSKSALVDLVLKGEADCFRSGRAFLFRVKKDKSDSQQVASLENCEEM